MSCGGCEPAMPSLLAAGIGVTDSCFKIATNRFCVKRMCTLKVSSVSLQALTEKVAQCLKINAENLKYASK